MTIAIKKTKDEYGDTKYLFFGESANYHFYDLGSASLCWFNCYDEEEDYRWEGRFDTREIVFHSDEELLHELKRVKPDAEIYFLD